MTRFKLLGFGLLGAGLFCSIAACGSEEKAADEAEDVAGPAGVVAPPAQDFGMGGQGAAGTSSVTMPTAGTGMAAAGTGAGMAAAGTGTGGQSGSAGGNGSAGRAGAGGAAAGAGGEQADAGAANEDDPFGLFDPAGLDELSCEGLLCVEAADCASLYPDEAAACKFTTCQDFVCQ
jgi:hypothetical protein